MIEDVEISDGNLVIHFNTDSDIKDIYIPLTEIFDPEAYYTKQEIDNQVNDIWDTIDEKEEVISTSLNALNEEVGNLSNGKADASALTAHTTDTDAHFTDGQKSKYDDFEGQYYNEDHWDIMPQSAFEDFAGDFSTAMGQFDQRITANENAIPTKADKSDTYTKTETDNAIATAMEDIDLSDYVDVTTFNKKELATAKALTQLNDTKADKTELPDVSTLATKSEVEALEPYAIDLDAYVANGITEAQYDEIVQAVSDGRVIKATYETRDYIVESVYVDGDVMKISLSDELKHRFFQFGRSTGTVSPTTAEYVSLVEKGVWNTKANASDVYTKTEIDAMIGNINTILASI